MHLKLYLKRLKKKMLKDVKMHNTKNKQTTEKQQL